MRTVKLSRPYTYMGTYYDDPAKLRLPDDVANLVVRDGGGEFSDGEDVANAGDNPLRDVVEPLVPDADPLHSARALSLKVEAHPGLVALNEARPDLVAETGRVKPGPAVDPKGKAAPVAKVVPGTPPPGPVVGVPAEKK